MPSSPTVRFLIALIILVTVVGLTFYPSLKNQFVNWDDQSEITENPDFNPVTAQGLAWNWTHTRLSLWMPVTYMTWGAVAEIASRDGRGMLNPFAFHLLNLILHFVFCGLTMLLIFRLWNRALPALIGALAVAVHPLVVEPVAWASGMYTLLSAVFAAGALVFYVTAVRKTRRFGLYFALATMLYIAALLTKAASVSLPLAAGAIDLLVICRPVRAVIRPLLPWIVLGIPVVLLAKHFQDLSQIAPEPLWARPMIALDAMGFYLRKIFLPVGLIPDYGRNPTWVLQHPLAMVISGLTAVAALLLAWLARRNAAWITAGTGFLLAGISPYLGLTAFDFQYVSTVADRYAYFGLIGLAVLVAGAVIRSRVAAIGLLIAIGCWVVISHRQVRNWRDNQALFGYTLAVNPRSLISHNVFGFLAAKQGNLAEAEANYLAALNVWPQDAVIQFNLGNLYLKSHPQLAVRRYGLAVQYDPHFAVYRNSYAAALSRLGQPQQAYEQWKQAIADDPEYLDARHNLADLCANAGGIDEARAGYQAALRIDPHDGYALQKLNELPPR